MELTITQREDIAAELRAIMMEVAAIREELSQLRKRDAAEDNGPVRILGLPDIADSAKLPIGQAAKLLGISRDTLRDHTNNGYIKCTYSRANKRRMYMGSELKRYWRAYC